MLLAAAAADHEIVEHNMGHIPTVDLLPALADLDVAVVAADVDRVVADTDLAAETAAAAAAGDDLYSIHHHRRRRQHLRPRRMHRPRQEWNSRREALLRQLFEIS